MPRIVIIGNCGSGKTFLANQLAKKFAWPVVHFDDHYWLTPACEIKRPTQLVHQEIEEKIKGEHWIMEGVLGELADLALKRANMLLFLNLPWSVCKSSLQSRGPEGQTADGFAELLEWSSSYGEREGLNSYQGHNRLFHAFRGDKLELVDRAGVDGFFRYFPG